MKKSRHIPPYYPVSLSLSGRKCLVVGGGSVAQRKVATLLEHDAEVRVISPELCPELEQMAAKGLIKALAREYQSGDLKGAFVVIAATDDGKINDLVAQEAEQRGMLVNVVDDPTVSNFIVPSYLRRGDITVAVSTAGRSPALARKIRHRLEKEFGAEYATLARLIDDVRSELKEGNITISGESWQRAIDIDLLSKMLRAGQTAKARATLLRSLKKPGGGEM